jgi:DNA polymerase LigD, ligase domain
MAKKPRDAPRSIGLVNEAEPPLRGQRRRKPDPAQPQLPLDPMPARIEPCLALLSKTVPEGPQWGYEIKWDGYRVAVHVEMGRVRVLTKGGHDWTARFPGIAEAARTLGPATAIFDGEAVVLDEQGRSDFNALISSIGGRGGRGYSKDAVLYAFDLLYLDGHDLTRMDLQDRRSLLDPLLVDMTGPLRLSEMIDAEGPQLIASACELGLEGIIAKRLDAPYRAGRNGDWRKIKCVQSETFVIIGYRASSGTVASLLMAARSGDGLAYVGSVGTGFKEAVARRLKSDLDRIRRKKAVVPVSDMEAIFVEPILAAEVEYRAWTSDRKLRHPSFKGLRDEADDVEIYRLD